MLFRKTTLIHTKVCPEKQKLKNTRRDIVTNIGTEILREATSCKAESQEMHFQDSQIFSVLVDVRSHRKKEFCHPKFKRCLVNTKGIRVFSDRFHKKIGIQNSNAIHILKYCHRKHEKFSFFVAFLWNGCIFSFQNTLQCLTEEEYFNIARFVGLLPASKFPTLQTPGFFLAQKGCFSKNAGKITFAPLPQSKTNFVGKIKCHSNTTVCIFADANSLSGAIHAPNCAQFALLMLLESQEQVPKKFQHKKCT